MKQCKMVLRNGLFMQGDMIHATKQDIIDTEIIGRNDILIWYLEELEE